jgi:hypothetical protein
MLYMRSVSGFSLEPLLLELARRFAAAGMTKHLAALRRHYMARRKRLRAAALGSSEWTEDFVLEWLCLLQIPPFDRFYAELPDGHCPCGARMRDGAGAHVQSVFPGGYLMRCLCGQTWLVRRDAPSADARAATNAACDQNPEAAKEP